MQCLTCKVTSVDATKLDEYKVAAALTSNKRYYIKIQCPFCEQRGRTRYVYRVCSAETFSKYTDKDESSGSSTEKPRLLIGSGEGQVRQAQSSKRDD